jgi:hypothetical protein
MKHFMLAALFALLGALHSYAQNQTLPEQLAYAHAPLDKTQLNSGCLWNLTVPLADPRRFKTPPGDSNYMNMDVFGFLYGCMAGASTPYGDALPSPSVYLDRMSPATNSHDVALALFVWRYDQIRPDAIDRNLIRYENGQFFDIPNRPFSPYFQDTLFAAAPLQSSVTGNHLVTGFI